MQARAIEIVGGEIVGRTVGRATTFGSLQGRIDDAGNTGRDFVLEVEHVSEQAVETVGPKVGAGFGIDQLRRDADPAAALADRPFKHIPDTEFASNLFYVG